MSAKTKTQETILIERMEALVLKRKMELEELNNLLTKLKTK